MSTSATISGSFAHRYTIERELGRGATSTVYLATDTTAARDVALKVLRRELAESVAADRFLREIRLNQSLQHRFIAPVLDSGEFEGDLFLVLPHMPGGSLRQLLERERQLSLEAVLEIVRSIGEGLQYAHERGLIHRDVKPENILFAGKQAYLADFGIARAIQRASGDTTTEAGVVRGTPGYMSPEQASGDRNYDGRSDQYSFACVVYEMLAGVPAFHGPTPEATIALRFRHPARKLNVYRSTVPSAVEGVIEKAMSLAPADRYVSVGDFVKLFEAAVAAPPESTSVSAQPTRVDRRRMMVAVAAGACAVVALAVYGATHSWFTGGGVPADTTQVVVFPPEVTGASTNGTVPLELLRTAVRRWQDLHVVPLDRTLDALSRRGPGRLAPDEMRSIAMGLHARRFMVVRPLRTSTGSALFAEYRDVEAGPLHDAQLDLPSDSSQVAAVYAALADSMVLRGASDGGVPGGTGPRHLFATQAFIRAMNARQDWDLKRADSELALAVSLDPTFSRAFLWQAQQKLWGGLGAQTWTVLAERALTDTAALTPSERLMGRALALMGQGQYPTACGVYKTLIREDAMSFASWYGLGECNLNDHTVVAGVSPSGWRFRGSLQEAITSYVRAFQLIPATYRGFGRSDFKRLRDLLFVSGNRLTPGNQLGQSAGSFLGVPALVGDSVVLVAWPRDAVLSQRVSTNSPPKVVLRLRAAFDTVVTRWANAFPLSAEAKEALAISLEIRGEPSALDTLEAVERLTTDRTERIRLAATRVSLQLKFASDTTDLERALKSADSLLEANKVPATPEIAGFIAPVAAMTGACARTGQLLRQAAQASGVTGIPRDVRAKVVELKAYVSVGCSPSGVWRQLDEIDKSIANSQAAENAKNLQYMELNTIVRASLPSDSAWVTRLAAAGGHTIAAERDLVLRRPDSARARLRLAARARQAALPGQVTADAVVPEAKVWLALADTGGALASLEMALNTVRQGTPLITDQPEYNTARIGFLVQAYALHAQLLAGRDRVKARQSARVTAIMWRHADADLLSTVARMREIIK